MLSTDLHKKLRMLRLSGMANDIPHHIEQAVKNNIPHETFLLGLFTDELERRYANKLKANLKKASFSEYKEMNDFDFAFNPDIPRAQVIELGTMHFIEKAQPVILCGPTGVGKSHLAQALGHQAVRKGYKVLFSDARELLMDLRARRGDGSVHKYMKALCRLDLLVLDDLGLHPLKSDEAYDLYDLIRKRHNRHATLITSNRDITEWGDLFPDPLIASAALDRILENAVVISLQGRSYRARKKAPPS